MAGIEKKEAGTVEDFAHFFLEKMKEKKEDEDETKENTHPNPIVGHVLAVSKYTSWNIIEF